MLTICTKCGSEGESQDGYCRTSGTIWEAPPSSGSSRQSWAFLGATAILLIVVGLATLFAVKRALGFIQ